MLQRWKMSVNDIQVMQLGSSPNMLASLDKGGIEGAVVTIPSMFVAEDRGYRVLLDMADTDIYYLHTMVATTRQYIKNNRDKVLRFLRGYVEGIAFVKQNKKESVDIVKKKLRIRSRAGQKSRTVDRSVDRQNTTRRSLIRLCAALRRCSASSRRTILKPKPPIRNRSSTTAC